LQACAEPPSLAPARIVHLKFYGKADGACFCPGARLNV
jgi:hypothetical protein